MGLPVEINPLLLVSKTTAYSVSKSLRFRSSASAYLNRTPASAGNQTKFTISLWFKRGALTTYGALFDAYSGAGANYGILQLQNDDTLLWFNQTASTITAKIQTNAVYRDPSAWYHVVAVYDSTQATASNRLSMYVNGSQVTSFSIATYPTLNQTNTINGTVPHDIGRYGGAANYFDGYMAEVNFIDGQALTPSSFGAYDTNGVWQPAKYSGSYGTNGFYLPFSNTTSTATLVADSSGNGNNWTPNNISLTAGSTYDSMTDSPTVSSASVANYAVMSPIDKEANCSVTGGNLDWSSNAAGTGQTRGTIGVNSGKWYWEVTITSTASTAVGISTSQSSLGLYPGGDAYGWAYLSANGNKYNNGSGVAYGATFTNGDVIGVALDVGGGTLTFYKNNTSQGTAYTGLSALTYFPSLGDGSASTAPSASINFGQRPFTYTPPNGFNALNTYNLPTPAIANGAQYMAATTYTGTGASLTINNGTNTTIGTTFQPDLVWMKSRSAATDHALFDVVRGTTLELISDSTAAETTQATGLTAFGSTGFTIGAEAKLNTSTATYVGWQWKANGAGVSNTNGSITSTVSANTTAGFSVVTYTGTGANATVGHGLGVAPSMIIVKARSIVENWPTWHTSLTSAAYVLTLNTTNAQASVPSVFNSTLPTSSVFSIGTSTGSGGSGTTYVAYCWAAVPGYSAFGSYTGNGSTDGPFVYTGFRPRFVMFKRADAINTWLIYDTSRSPYNADIAALYPNTSAAEANDDPIDYLSNGFKMRFTGNVANTSGGTYIYAAFAENPFQSSRAR